MRAFPWCAAALAVGAAAGGLLRECVATEADAPVFSFPVGIEMMAALMTIVKYRWLECTWLSAVVFLVGLSVGAVLATRSSRVLGTVCLWGTLQVVGVFLVVLARVCYW